MHFEFRLAFYRSVSESKILDLWRSLEFYLHWIIYWYVIQRSCLNQFSRIIQGYSKGLTVWSEQIHPPTWRSQLCHTDQSRTRDQHPHQDGIRPSVDWDDRELQLWKFCLNIKNDIHMQTDPDTQLLHCTCSCSLLITTRSAHLLWQYFLLSSHVLLSVERK